MKKTIYRAFSLVGVTSLVFLANACLKDDARFTDFGSVGNTIEFLDQNPGKSTAISFDDPSSPDGDTIWLRVHQAGPYATGTDLTVTLGASQAGIDLYNLDGAHVPGSPLPADAYSFPSTVTIVAGKDALGNNNRTVEFPLIIYPNKVPTTLGVNYVLSLGVTNVSPETTISANNGVILFNFYKNAFDGSYHRTGTLDRAGTPTDPIDEQGDLITVNATTSAGQASWFGNPTLTFFVVVDPDDNSVVIAADPAAAYPITGDGTFDPATETFTVHYSYTSSASRDFHETWVKN